MNTRSARALAGVLALLAATPSRALSRPLDETRLFGGSDLVRLSADGSRAAYVVGDGEEHTVVFGSIEVGGLHTIDYLAISDDGEHVAFVGEDVFGERRLYHDGEALEIGGKPYPDECLRFSRSGEPVLLVSDGEAYWIAVGDRLRSRSAPRSAWEKSRGFALSPDRDRVAYAVQDGGTVRVVNWNLADGSESEHGYEGTMSRRSYEEGPWRWSGPGLEFSADGASVWAYVFLKKTKERRLYLDGELYASDVYSWEGLHPTLGEPLFVRSVGKAYVAHLGARTIAPTRDRIGWIAASPDGWYGAVSAKTGNLIRPLSPGDGDSTEPELTAPAAFTPKFYPHGLVWFGDGPHVAYLREQNRRQGELHVDGKRVAYVRRPEYYDLDRPEGQYAREGLKSLLTTTDRTHAVVIEVSPRFEQDGDRDDDEKVSGIAFYELASGERTRFHSIEPRISGSWSDLILSPDDRHVAALIHHSAKDEHPRGAYVVLDGRVISEPLPLTFGRVHLGFEEDGLVLRGVLSKAESAQALFVEHRFPLEASAGGASIAAEPESAADEGAPAREASRDLASMQALIDERRALGDHRGVARVLEELGVVAELSPVQSWMLGDYYREVSRRLDADAAFEAAVASASPLGSASDPDRLAATRSLVALGRPREALGVVEAHGSGSEAWQLERALAEFHLGDGSALATLLASDGLEWIQDPWSRVRASSMLASVGETARAVRMLEALLVDKPDFGFAWEVLASIHDRSGQYARALACADRAIEASPDSAVAHNVRGSALYNTGAVVEASHEYARTLELEPRYVRALTNLARAWVDLGQHEKAFEVLERARSMDPELADTYDVLGLVLTSLGRLPDALKAFDRAIELSPGYEAARLNRVGVLIIMGRSERALEEAEWLIEHATNPDVRARAWLNRGNALEGRGDYEGLLQSVLRGLELSPRNADLRYTRAKALALLGRLQAALTVVEDLLEEYPDLAHARQLRGMILERR